MLIVQLSIPLALIEILAQTPIWNLATAYFSSDPHNDTIYVLHQNNFY
jgi:hypothetical protein